MFNLIQQAHANEFISDNPNDWDVGLWLMLFIISLPGGISNWWSAARDKKITWRWFIDIMRDILCSSSVTVIAFMFSIDQFDNMTLALAIAGSCGHLAPRFIFSGNALLDVATNKYIRKIDPENKLATLTHDQLAVVAKTIKELENPDGNE
jgi:Cu/Ag efflux protein CusF